MKILWFTNTPVNAYDDSNNLKSSGGWLNALEYLLNSDSRIKLGIVFFSRKKRGKFSKGTTKYFPLYKPKKTKLEYLKNLYINNNSLKNKHQLKIQEVLNDFQPDIVHFHGTESELIGAQNLLKNTPFVVSIQGVVSSINYQIKHIDKFYPLSLEYPIISLILYIKMAYRKRRIKTASLRERNIYKRTKYLIGRTYFDRTISNLLSHDNKYFVLNEILRKEFYQNRWSESNNKKYLIYTTTKKNFLKGFNIIVETINILKQKNFIFEWRIGGLSSSDLVVKIMKKKLGAEYPDKEIKIMGRLNAKEIINNMNQSDVYVMASHIENSPNNLAEAMIFGMPCIASNVGGASSLLKNFHEGVLYQHSDPLSLAAAIYDSYINRDKYIQYGINARTRALARHDNKKILNKLIDIYSYILNN